RDRLGRNPRGKRLRDLPGPRRIRVSQGGLLIAPGHQADPLPRAAPAFGHGTVDPLGAEHPLHPQSGTPGLPFSPVSAPPQPLLNGRGRTDLFAHERQMVQRRARAPSAAAAEPALQLPAHPVGEFTGAERSLHPPAPGERLAVGSPRTAPRGAASAGAVPRPDGGRRRSPRPAAAPAGPDRWRWSDPVPAEPRPQARYPARGRAGAPAAPGPRTGRAPGWRGAGRTRRGYAPPAVAARW